MLPCPWFFISLKNCFFNSCPFNSLLQIFVLLFLTHICQCETTYLGSYLEVSKGLFSYHVDRGRSEFSKLYTVLGYLHWALSFLFHHLGASCCALKKSQFLYALIAQIPGCFSDCIHIDWLPNRKRKLYPA
jgi:hypothetical protein